MIRVIVCGARGRMGREVVRLAEGDPGFALAAAVDRAGGGAHPRLADYTGPADVLIDFSGHDATAEIMEYCIARRLPAVVAVTGHTPMERALIQSAARCIPVLQSANLSLGVHLLARLVRQVSAAFPGAGVEIVETHHTGKKDAPSGTALLLAGQLDTPPTGIHSLRLGNAAGIHEVHFATETETITLRHQVHDRALFAQGALKAAAFLVGKTARLYGMSHLLEEQA